MALIHRDGKQLLQCCRILHVIIEMAGEAVNTHGEVRDALGKARREGKRLVLMQVKSGETTRFVAVPPDPA
jgi:hypothetical protein